MELHTDEDFIIKPSFTDRGKSVVIDGFFVVFLLYLCFILTSTLNIQSATTKLALLILVFLYEPIAVAFSRTLGQKIMKIRVCNKKSYLNTGSPERINILWSLLRYLLKLGLGWISLLTIHSDKYGQAIHDLFAGSIMIHSKD